MATAQAALKTALRDILSPALRSQGFKGSGITWTHETELGDVAIVNVQSSSWSTREEVRCFVDLAVAPDPWMDWRSTQTGQPRRKSPKENDGLWRSRLDRPTPPGARGSEPWWVIHDMRSAEVAVTEMRDELIGSSLARLRELVTREGLIAAVREGDLGYMKKSSFGGFFDRMLALLLVDEGPSDELARLQTQFTASQSEHLDKYDEKFIPWLTTRLAYVTSRAPHSGSEATETR